MFIYKKYMIFNQGQQEGGRGGKIPEAQTD